MAPLADTLTAALTSRDRRLIRRRLPEPASHFLDEIDFTSNDYLSLATSSTLRTAVLTALAASPTILGASGSRLLVPAQPHTDLEDRSRQFFHAEAALLFNSGFDANVGFFSAVPQPDDVVLYDAHIHASVHDGMHLSRLPPDARRPFAHNSVAALRAGLAALCDAHAGLLKGTSNAFIAVESLYSMDGTIAPLAQIVACVEAMLPLGNGYVVVDEAHATGVYGPKGRGLVVALGLENRVFARLHTFGKALAASGAVLVTTQVVKDYLLNYARSLIYTTALPFANVVAIQCSFDLLENGTTETLATRLLDLCTYFIDLLRTRLKIFPRSLLSLPDHLAPTAADHTHESPPRPWETDPHDEPVQSVTPDPEPYLASPIIPLLTSDPRNLSHFLLDYASDTCPTVLSDTSPPSPPPRPVPSSGVRIRTKPIHPPTVAKGTARLRICLHAGHTQTDVGLLVDGIVAWGALRMAAQHEDVQAWRSLAREMGVGTWMETRL